MIHFTEEHETIREMVHSFSDNELRPHAEAVDAGGLYPKDRIQQLAQLGLLGAALPENLGGTDGDTMTAIIIALELGSGCPSTALPIAIHSLAACLTILDHGSDSQKSDLLPRLGAGELLATACVHELEGALVARQDGDGWVLEGTKDQVVAATEADLYLVTAGIEGASAPEDRAVFIVPAGTAGLSANSEVAHLGLRGAGLGSVTFERCTVGSDAMLGSPSLAPQRRLADLGHLSAAAVALGIARSAWRYALDYARERKAFGGPIHRFEVLRRYLAEAATSCAAAELLLYHAATQRDRSEDLKHTPSMAKLSACNAAYTTTKNAVQILGGNGYSREYPVERWFRDAKTLEVLEIPTEQHAQRIAASLIGETA